jgi:hypothetical protein
MRLYKKLFESDAQSERSTEDKCSFTARRPSFGIGVNFETSLLP